MNPFTAIFGGKAYLPTPDGIKIINIKAGTNSGDRLKISGEGIKNNVGTGNIIGEIHFTSIPKLSREQREILQELSNVETSESVKWRDKVKKYLDS